MCQTACLDQTGPPVAVNSPAFWSRRQVSFRLQRSRRSRRRFAERLVLAQHSARIGPDLRPLAQEHTGIRGAQDMTFTEPLCAACRLPRRLRSMNLARSYSAMMPCIWSNRSSSGLLKRNRLPQLTLVCLFMAEVKVKCGCDDERQHH